MELTGESARQILWISRSIDAAQMKWGGGRQTGDELRDESWPCFSESVTHTHTHARMRTHMHPQIHTYTHTYTHNIFKSVTQMHTHTHTRTYAHAKVFGRI